MKVPRIINIALLSLSLNSMVAIPHSSAFVLLSGPAEAKLGVSPTNPSVTFLWDGIAPDLLELENLEDGRWVGLSNEDAMEQIILMALDMWNAVPASYIQLTLQKNTDVLTSSEDGIHTIQVKQNGNLSSAAYAVPTIKGKIITDCDISVNNRSVTASALTYTIVHELGHCLGLGHAHSNYGAIMGYSRLQRALRLGADDIAGAIYLYTEPGYQNQKKEFLGCAVISSSSSAKARKTHAIFGLFLIPLILLAGEKLFNRTKVRKKYLS